MNQTPILHFHGKFRFDMPEYNNDPTNGAVPFDPNLPRAEVMSLCGCDPAHYFEFEFVGVTVTQVTYSDGTQAVTGDAVLAQDVRLTGIMPDVSASAICAQLFAGRLRVGRALRGDVDIAIQSDLRLNVRPLGFTDETAAAHFDAAVAVRRGEALAGSRWFQELQSDDLELHFHLNRYTRLDNPEAPGEARLTGDVYGYLRPGPAETDRDGLRVAGRRLVAHPRLPENPAVERTFLLETGGMPVIRITDIDGTYDVLADDGLITLRHLHFVPFLDLAHGTPDVDGYDVYLEGPEGRVPVGRFRGDHAEMVTTGGILVFPLPPGTGDRDDLRLAVDVVRDGEFAQPLMVEPDLDLVLESPRGVQLASGEATQASARVYRSNRPAPGHPVRVKTQPSNRRSPVVARMDGDTLSTDDDGRVVATLRALDLRHTGGVDDPVTGQAVDDLPFDRYYGNYVYIEIDQPLRRTTPPVEQIEIATRVVHRIAPEQIPERPSFRDDVSPLFSYYLRYFPWLHTVDAAGQYIQFLDLSDYGVVSTLASTIVSRLEEDIAEPMRMPRSRDFPAGGVELIQRWIDAGLQE